jgi:protein TIF31
VALFDSNIGLILQAVGEFDLSLRFLQKALELHTRFFGDKSLKVAMSYHLVARAYSCKGDFRTALNHEKEAYTIYKGTLGEEHERTRESSECLKHLTQQAVKFQKTMNDIYKGETAVNIPPLQIQTPTLANVLETLNLINGIVFVHISQEDIEKFREEMLRRQQQSNDDEKTDASKTGDDKAIEDVPKENNNVDKDSPAAAVAAEVEEEAEVASR